MSWLIGYTPLVWRHNGQDGVSNHQPHDYLLNCLFRPRSTKTSKLRVTDLCVGNSTVTGEFPAQMASNGENVSIWWRYHACVVRKWLWWCEPAVTNKPIVSRWRYAMESFSVLLAFCKKNQSYPQRVRNVRPWCFLFFCFVLFFAGSLITLFNFAPQFTRYIGGIKYAHGHVKGHQRYCAIGC